MINKLIFKKSKTLLTFYFRLFGLYILFFIIVAILQQLLPEIDLKKYSQDTIKELLNDNKLKAFFAMVIFAPIYEELMFRTLLKPTQKDILLFLSSWSLFFISLIIHFDFQWYYGSGISIAILIASYFCYKKLLNKVFLTKVILLLRKNEKITLQITSLAFGFMHIFNYVDTLMIDTVLFLMIVPRIIAGHMNGSLKIRNNHIIWPILLHAINNGVIFFMITLAPS